MNVKAGYVTPMLHVKSVQDSIRFYALLGFELMDRMGEAGQVGWARMHCEGGALMFFAAEEGVEAHPLMLYLYTPALPALREHLLANGLQVTPISHPDYMPSGELALKDPDGNLLFVGHWSDAEDERWERERKERISSAI